MRERTAAAARLLAYKIVRRAERGAGTDDEAALALTDRRLAPDSGERRSAISRARGLAAAILSERRPGGLLEGDLRFDLRVVRPGRGARRRTVVVPLRVHHPDGTVSVVAVSPAGGDGKERLREYRRAAEAVFGRPGGRAVRAFLAGPDSALAELLAELPAAPSPSLASGPERGSVEAPDVLGAPEGDPGAGPGARRP